MAGLTSRSDLTEAGRHLAEQARRGSLVVFLGAGVSRNAVPPRPTWQELVAPLKKELGLPADAEVDLLDLPQWYADACGRAALHEHVRQRVSGGEPGRMHDALAALPVPVFVTTNYDDLMERAIAARQGVPPDVIVEDGHVGLIDEAQRTILLKMHGCLSLPGTIVLARSDYEEYAERHRAIVAYLQSLLATRTFLFVGFGLTDPNFRSIHHAIHRAVSAYQRPAYVLDIGTRPTPLLDYWRNRGLRILLFADQVAEGDFLVELARASGDRSSAVGAARALGQAPPSPPLAVEQLIVHAEGIHRALSDLVEQARRADWLPRERRELSGGGDAASAGGWVRDKARALLGLTLAVDGLTPLEDPGLWISLGDVLYEQGDHASAIRAYGAVLRPPRHGRDEARSPGVDAVTLRRVWGNLGRAYAGEQHFARSEWLLRRCVFEPGKESPSPWFDRRSVLDRLDLDHLAERPTDAYELVYAITRRAERLRGAGHLVEAFEALREARCLLEPVLGIDKHGVPAPRGDLFATYRGADGEGRRGRALTQERRKYLQAWALSFLGKAYRLSCELALDLRHGQALAAVPSGERQRFTDAPYYLEEAERHLHESSRLGPALPYAYGHRLHLQADERLPGPERRRLLEGVRADLRRLAAGSEPRARLERDFPALVATGG